MVTKNIGIFMRYLCLYHMIVKLEQYYYPWYNRRYMHMYNVGTKFISTLDDTFFLHLIQLRLFNIYFFIFQERCSNNFFDQCCHHKVRVGKIPETNEKQIYMHCSVIINNYLLSRNLCYFMIILVIHVHMRPNLNLTWV